jgi:hypothetical protein
LVASEALDALLSRLGPHLAQELVAELAELGFEVARQNDTGNAV